MLPPHSFPPQVLEANVEYTKLVKDMEGAIAETHAQHGGKIALGGFNEFQIKFLRRCDTLQQALFSQIYFERPFSGFALPTDLHCLPSSMFHRSGAITQQLQLYIFSQSSLQTMKLTGCERSWVSLSATFNVYHRTMRAIQKRAQASLDLSGALPSPFPNPFPVHFLAVTHP
jgi:hypothetical protein